MQITPKQLQEFKEHCKEEFGKDITNSKAYSQASMLLEYVKIGMEEEVEKRTIVREFTEHEFPFSKIIFPKEYSQFSKEYVLFTYDCDIDQKHIIFRICNLKSLHTNT